MKNEFYKNKIVTLDGQEIVLEDLYKAFKERLVNDVKVVSSGMQENKVPLKIVAIPPKCGDCGSFVLNGPHYENYQDSLCGECCLKH